MRKIEAATLEEAYAQACRELKCSMKELEYEVVQYPNKGLFGLFAKPAIIVALASHRPDVDEEKPTPAGKPISGKREGKQERAERKRDEEKLLQREENARTEEPKRDSIPEHPSERKILDGFFSEESEAENPAEGEAVAEGGEGRNLPLQEEIETKLRELMDRSCFDLDVVEVDVIDDTAYIFMDGEDAALVIGKEGYRYNALSYLLYQWIHGRYKLHTKLEIARFLTSQEEMIRSFIQPVIEHVEREGWGRTRPLDGVLVQIALEQLREAFPDKYVAAKRHRDGKRYILINEFNRRK
ncbi:Jag N-terminal domain-containing protein [Nitratifractor sp.]